MNDQKLSHQVTEIAYRLTSALELSLIVDELGALLKSLTEVEDWLLMIDVPEQDLILMATHYFKETIPFHSGDQLLENALFGYEEHLCTSKDRIFQIRCYLPEFNAPVEGWINLPLIVKGLSFGNLHLFFNNHDAIDQHSDTIQTIQAIQGFLAIGLNNTLRYQQLLEINQQDSLTGLLNYRAFLNILDREKRYVDQHDAAFSLVFVDIDFFKQVNDMHGHLTGSKVLKDLSQVFMRDLRQHDCITRYGGDEYVILLKRTGRKEAFSVAERLRMIIKSTPFIGENGVTEIFITASFGLATYPDDGNSVNDIIELADRNMYEVKQTTRDGVKGTSDTDS